MAPPPDFIDAVTAAIAAIPSGDAMTYGEIAQEAGFPGAARAVGNVLATSGGTLPWWRGWPPGARPRARGNRRARVFPGAGGGGPPPPPAPRGEAPPR